MAEIGFSMDIVSMSLDNGLQFEQKFMKVRYDSRNREVENLMG